MDGIAIQFEMFGRFQGGLTNFGRSPKSGFIYVSIFQLPGQTWHPNFLPMWRGCILVAQNERPPNIHGLNSQTKSVLPLVPFLWCFCTRILSLPCRLLMHFYQTMNAFEPALVCYQFHGLPGTDRQASVSRVSNSSKVEVCWHQFC